MRQETHSQLTLPERQHVPNRTYSEGVVLVADADYTVIHIAQWIKETYYLSTEWDNDTHTHTHTHGH